MVIRVHLDIKAGSNLKNIQCKKVWQLGLSGRAPVVSQYSKTNKQTTLTKHIRFQVIFHSNSYNAEEFFVSTIYSSTLIGIYF
jgi:hypothetical protein